MSTCLDEAKTLASQSDYDEALRVIERAESLGEKSADLFLMKARLLQLVDQDRTLEEAESALKSAISCDPKSVEALLEMGWFRLNVLDDPQEAQKVFEAALQIQAHVNTEIVSGLTKCRMELGSDADLNETLRRMTLALVLEDRLREAF